MIMPEVLADGGIASDAGLVVLILALVLLFVGSATLAISGSVSALGHSHDVWTTIGRKRSRWAWQAVGVVFWPVSLIYSGAYFFSVNPALVAVERSIAIERSQAAATAFATGAEPKPYPGAAVDEKDVRFRIPLLNSLIPLLGIAPVLTFRLVSRHTGESLWTFLALGAVFLVLPSLALNRRFGVTLTPTVAVVRNLRTQRISWSDVQAVTDERVFGSRRVVLWTASGKKVNLRAPVTSLPRVGERKFEARADTITQWWLAHRGSPTSFEKIPVPGL